MNKAATAYGKAMNEEKTPVYFVWERRHSENKQFAYGAAKYRGFPQTGAGDEKDKKRYAFIQKLKPEEEEEAMVTLINRYPCPVPPLEGRDVPQRPVDLTRNELTRQEKKDQLLGQKVSPEDIDIILDRLYGSPGA